MENFLKLNEEKQKKIRDSALSSFAESGYKKTSVQEIADKADISKAMVFYYFGTKKDLYLYLMDYTYNFIFNAVGSNDCSYDFFDRMYISGMKKINTFKKEPFVFKFLMSIYKGDTEELKDELDKFMAMSKDNSEEFLLSDLELYKFKKDVDVELLYKGCILMSAGLNIQDVINIEDIDAKVKDFYDYMDMLKKLTYKEEYL